MRGGEFFIALATTTEMAKSLFSAVGIGCMSSLIFCSKRTLPLSEVPRLFCVRVLGVFDRYLPSTAHQYDISSGGEYRLDDVPFEVAPCEEWLLDEVN